ncbi:MAG TPA: hypothetical protein PKL15_12325, partial [Saprospiraceae bacterium]|nr:hypothetical protein [Saprospiraceae bacterium]
MTGNNTPPSVNTSGGTITCASSSVTLATTTGASNPGFAWTGPNGFTSTAQSPTVNASGAYTLTVADSTTGCTNTATANVAANTTAPGATAAGGTLTCTVSSVTLNGTSNGATVGYAWTGPGGFQSALPLTVATLPGAYTAAVQDTLSMQTLSQSVTVLVDTLAPVANAGPDRYIGCDIISTQLQGSAFSTHGTPFHFHWTTPTGHI